MKAVGLWIVRIGAPIAVCLRWRALRDDGHVARRPSSAYSPKAPAQGVLHQRKRRHQRGRHRGSAAYELAVGGADAADVRVRRPGVSSGPSRADRADRRSAGDPPYPEPSRPADRSAHRPARCGRLHSRSGYRVRGTTTITGRCPQRRRSSSPERPGAARSGAVRRGVRSSGSLHVV
jgi:hypothetical protein